MRVCNFACVVLVLGVVCLARAGAEGENVCHVGAQLHLQKGIDDETYLRHLRAFVEEGMADYALILAYTLDPNDLDAVTRYLRKHGVHFFLQDRFEADKRRYTRADLDRVRSIATVCRGLTNCGDLFLGVHWGELDSSGLVPEQYLPKDVYENPTRDKVKEAFVERVRTLVNGAHKECGVPVGHSSALLFHHLFAEAGADVICSEIGENAPNANMMIASNRGTARAYGKRWMIDHSTWWSPRGNAGEQVSPREGHTPWCFFTTLLGAAMGGADFVQLEVDWAAYPADSLFKPAGTKPGPLLPWGQALKTLYSVTREIGPRGKTATPFAILIGHQNGWPGVGWRTGDVRGTGLFDGIRHKFMQTRDADLSLKILDVFYPGFERCGWDPEYPGFLAESPLGTLDIVPDNLTVCQTPTNCAPDKYSRYAALVALGYHHMTGPVCDALTHYVEKGGVLICGDTLFLDENEKPLPPDIAEPLIGCVYDASDDALVHLYQPTAKLDSIEGFADAGARDEWQDHWLHPVRPTTARVAARMNDVPYMVENRLGAGRVFFVTALNMVGSDAQRRGQEPFLYANILYHFLHTLEDHIGDGITFTPWTSLEHIYDEKPDGSAMLLVMNHGDMPYRRDATMKNPQGFTRGRVAAQGTWEGWQEGAQLSFDRSGDTLAWSFQLPPRSFVLFEFSK